MLDWLRLLAARVRWWTARKRAEEEFSSELAEHLELLTEENVRRGMTPEEAQRAARVRLGGMTQLREKNRELRGFPFAEEMFGDLRYSLRMLRKNFGLTLVVVLTLGLGIGVNATVFGWVQRIVLRPLPGVAEPSRIVAIVPYYRGEVNSSMLSYPEFRDLAGLREIFNGVMGSHYTAAILTVNGQSEWVYGHAATANTFDVLGVQLEKGRGFLPEEERGEGGHPVLVISHALWQGRFGGAADIVGRKVELNRHLFTIVGVTPPELQGVSGGYRSDFWAPLAMHNEVLNYGSFDSRTFRWVTPLARLRAGVTARQADAAVQILASQLEKAYPESNEGVRFQAFPLWRAPIGGQAEFLPLLRILVAVGAGVLLMVVANVGNLLLAQGGGREKEVGIRLAMGAGRWQLFRQLLMESLLLGTLGGALGIVVSRWAFLLFSAFLSSSSAYGREYKFGVNAEVLVFTAAVTLAAAALSGVLPAWRLSTTELQRALKESGRGSGQGVRHRRVRNVLVAIEMAVAMVLLVCAGLCIKGFARAKRTDLGFDPTGLLCAQLNLVPNGYTAEQGRVFDRQLRERLAALPGVTEVGLSSALPLGAGNIFTATVDVEGYTPAASEDLTVSLNMVSPGYFSAMRIPILEGRDFTGQEDARRQRVIIVDETMARRFWPRRNPIGRRVYMAVGVAPRDVFTVVGVVKAGKYRSLSEPPTPFVYLAYEQRPLASLFMGVVLRTRGDPETMAPLVRREIHALDATVEPLGVQTVEEYIRPAFAQANVAARFLVALGAAALLLAVMGLYSVMAYIVSRRSHEIGIRMALGAQRWSVSKMILATGARLALFGIGGGFVACLLLTRLLASLLYGVSARDPATYVLVAAILVTVAVVACYWPARRAMRVDPMVPLRHE